jgi:hypothetical protein
MRSDKFAPKRIVKEQRGVGGSMKMLGKFDEKEILSGNLKLNNIETKNVYSKEGGAIIDTLPTP